MNRRDFFDRIRERCKSLYTPEMDSVWKPIIEQLDYLIAFESEEAIDRAMIQNIDVGLRALRNLDDIYPDLARELYEVQRNAESMAIENGMRNRLAI